VTDNTKAMLAFESNRSPPAHKEAILDSHHLADFQEWPGLAWNVRIDYRLYCSNLRIINGNGCFGDSTMRQPRNCKNWEPFNGSSRQKRYPGNSGRSVSLNRSDHRRPTLVIAETFIALAGQLRRDDILITTSNLQRKPRINSFSLGSIPLSRTDLVCVRAPQCGIWPSYRHKVTITRTQWTLNLQSSGTPCTSLIWCAFARFQCRHLAKLPP